MSDQESDFSSEDSDASIHSASEFSSAGSGTSSSEDAADRHCKAEGNAGMADVIAKMLGKKVAQNQPVVLTKRKSKHQAEARAEAKKKKLATAAHQDWEEQQHIVPELGRNELERRLHSTATKGVIKLFNAVSKQQKELKAELEEAPTEAKREKVVSSLSQDHFLEMLRGGNTMVTGPIARKKAPASLSTSEKKAESSSKVKKESSEAAPWSVLQDNFMMDAKMKDWDRENSDEDDSDNGAESEMDDDSESD